MSHRRPEYARSRGSAAPISPCRSGTQSRRKSRKPNISVGTGFGLAIARPREDIPPMSDAQVPAVERRSRVAPTLKGVERAKLLDELAALHEGHPGDVAAFRRAAVEILRAALDAGRDEARRALEAGGTGRACAETLSAETDELLRVGLEMSVRWLAATLSSGPLPTIVAVGGYGRGMLAPYSDVDVLFLMPNKSPPGNGEGRRGAALCALGPEAQGWPCDANNR